MNQDILLAGLSPFIVFFIFFLFSLTTSSIISQQQTNHSYATKTDLHVSIDPALTLDVDTDSVDLGKPDVTAAAVVTSDITATVSTNNPTGYVLSVSTLTAQTCMRTPTNISSDTACSNIPTRNNIPTLDSGVATASFPANHWGAATSPFSMYYPIPSSIDASWILKDSPAKVVDDFTTLRIATKADLTLYPGTYANSIILNALANALPTAIVTSADPDAGDAGTSITLIGANFDFLYDVLIGATPCDNLNIIDSTSATCEIPEGESGTVRISTISVFGNTDISSVDITIGSGPHKTPFNSANSGTGIVETDSNMIPVKYVGNNSSPIWAKADITNNGNDWFNYDDKLWANAVTVTAETLEYYTAAGVDTIVDEADVLGYWVYIPRYAYEIARLSPWHKPAATQTPYNIRFETNTSPKKTPYVGIDNSTTYTYGETCLTAPTSQVSASSTGGPDYLTQCGVDRTYPTSAPYDRSTWGTHPAFSLDKNSDGDFDDDGEELNGFWVGKYELGSDTQCRNQATITDICGYGIILDGTTGREVYIKAAKAPMTTKYLGALFTQILNLSTNPVGITGGHQTVGQGEGINIMNLSDSAQTSMINTRMWGAATYLSTSNYGIGDEVCCTNNRKVFNNTYYNSAASANVTDTSSTPTHPSTSFYFMTGMGPNVSQSEATYGTVANAYFTVIGVEASTTGNATGIFDMAGGVDEYISASYSTTSSCQQTSTTYWAAGAPAAGWCDVFSILDGFSAGRPTWSVSSSAASYNNDICTWSLCGGRAIFEVSTAQSDGWHWGGDYGNLVYGSSSIWMDRGGYAGGRTYAGIFNATYGDGGPLALAGSRAILLP